MEEGRYLTSTKPFLITSGTAGEDVKLIHANSRSQAQRIAYVENGQGKLCTLADDVMLCQHAKGVLKKAGFTDAEITMFREHS